MAFNFNLPLGPWFVIIVIIVALFMALICTAIMYICCRGCYAAPTLPMNAPNATNPAISSLVSQDKPPSYRRFLRNLSNINLRVLGNSGANTSRNADTGTPPPKYGDVVSKFQFSSKEIKEFESMQSNFTAHNKFRPSISDALRQPPDRVRHQIIIPQLCITPPPIENNTREEPPVENNTREEPPLEKNSTEEPPPEYTPPSPKPNHNNQRDENNVSCYDNPSCVVNDVT